MGYILGGKKNRWKMLMKTIMIALHCSFFFPLPWWRCIVKSNNHVIYWSKFKNVVKDGLNLCSHEQHVTVHMCWTQSHDFWDKPNYPNNSLEWYFGTRPILWYVWSEVSSTCNEIYKKQNKKTLSLWFYLILLC